MDMFHEFIYFLWFQHVTSDLNLRAQILVIFASLLILENVVKFHELGYVCCVFWVGRG